MPKSRTTDGRGAPVSLLQTMRALRRWKGLKHPSDLINHVRDLRQAGYRIRGAKKRLSVAAWKDIERSRIDMGDPTLKYWDIELLQHVTHIPAGVILVASHMMQMFRDDHCDDLIPFTLGLEKLAAAARRLKKDYASHHPLTSQQRDLILDAFFDTWNAYGYQAKPPKSSDPRDL